MSLNLPGKFCFGKDRQRFLINTQVKNVDIRPMSVVLNWDAELNKK